MPQQLGKLGNKNACRHGLHGLTTGSLPPGCSYVRKKLGQLEAQLSRAVFDKHGEIDIVRAALIQSAVRHEARAALILRWMKKGASSMPDVVKLQFVRDLSAATDARDRCIRQLGIGARAQSAAESLYAPRAIGECAPEKKLDEENAIP